MKNKAIQRPILNFRKGFVSFAKDGNLARQGCGGVDTPAKCYDKNLSVIPMVDPEIEREYDKNKLKRQRFRGLNVVHMVKHKVT